jgi:hypothetical protein
MSQVELAEALKDAAARHYGFSVLNFVQ